MKKAFTIVELIFVIVIIGLLAGIAIPKFTATRDDAKVSQMTHNITTGMQEVATFAMSQGKIETSFLDMSNAIAIMVAGEEAIQVGDKLNIKMGNVTNCISLQIDDSNDVKIINITHNNAQGDSLCIALQEAMYEKRYDVPIIGAFVER